MADYHFHTGNQEYADQLVLTYHYSRRIPQNVLLVGSLWESGGLFGDLGRIIAACYFSIPATRWSEEVAELSRLVRCEDVHPQLSMLVSRTVKEMRRQKKADLLVSFADSTQGHHGGIYQASNWHYHGKRDARMDGLIVNGKFVTGRNCNHIWGTRSPRLLQERFPEWIIEPHCDKGKYLYWISLCRAGEEKAKRLGLESRSYPKPTISSCTKEETK